MKYLNFIRLTAFIGLITLISACQKSDDLRSDDNVALKSADNSQGFVHGIVVNVDGEDYYFTGPADGP